MKVTVMIKTWYTVSADIEPHPHGDNNFDLTNI